MGNRITVPPSRLRLTDLVDEICATRVIRTKNNDTKYRIYGMKVFQRLPCKLHLVYLAVCPATVTKSYKLSYKQHINKAIKVHIKRQEIARTEKQIEKKRNGATSHLCRSTFLGLLSSTLFTVVPILCTDDFSFITVELNICELGMSFCVLCHV